MKRKVLLISIIVVVVLMVVGVFTINTLFRMLITQEFRMGSEQDIKGGRPQEGVSNGRIDTRQGDKGDAGLPTGDGGQGDRGDVPQKGNNNAGVSAKGQNTDNTSSRTDIIVDEKKIKEIEKKVSLVDKTKALSILLKSLSAEDMGTLYQLARDGITDADKREAISLLSEKLTPEQKQAIKDLYYKYEGLLED